MICYKDKLKNRKKKVFTYKTQDRIELLNLKIEQSGEVKVISSINMNVMRHMIY